MSACAALLIAVSMLMAGCASVPSPSQTSDAPASTGAHSLSSYISSRPLPELMAQSSPNASREAGVFSPSFGASASGRLTVPSSQEMRGVWIASVENINFPSKKGLSAAEQKKELDEIVRTCQTVGINAIYFQARPSSDALYNSKIFPTSAYLTGTQGKANDADFDPLDYIIKIAHAKNIQVHAWINPYRITMGSATSPQHDLEALAPNHPARLNPSYAVKYADGKMYYNPALPEVRDLITRGVMEIVENYAVDGIHFDDYFYPYPVNQDGKKVAFNDAAEFKKYGGKMELDEFRRDNVNQLIKQVHDSIQKYDKSVRFGISPFGIWMNKSSTYPTGSATTGFNSYTELYCDAPTWIKNGYIDYICPQIYWSFGTKAAPFDVLVRWWSALVDGTDVDLYIGHGVYKVPTDFKSTEEIPRQIEYARSYMGVKGSLLYGYAALKENGYNIMDRITDFYKSPYKISDVKRTGSGVLFGRPANNSYYNNETISLMGASDPAYPVFYNGEKVTRTKDGYFTIFANLKSGKNTFTVTSNKKDYSHVINRGSAPTNPSPYVYPQMDKYEINLVRPATGLIVNSGEQVALRIQAPSGSTVTASFDGKTYTLKPQTMPPNKGNYMTEVYTTTITLPNAKSGDKLTDLGKVKFSASRNKGESATAESGNISLIHKDNYAAIEVTNDYSYLKISATSSFYDDYLNASEGMRDYITRLEGGYYKLRFGGYIAEENAKLLDGVVLNDNRMFSAAMEKFSKYTELRFDVTENVPLNAWVSGGKVYITVFNTKPDIFKELRLVDNPLFSEVKTTYDSSKSSVSYILTLKNADNYYGFRVTYESSRILLRFTHPSTIAEGSKPLKGRTIIVDAGHGGTDTGALGFLGTKGKNEKDLNLEISLELEKKLTELGANVVMTRTKDEAVSIEYRMDFLTKTNPDLCVSIHHNSMGDATDNTRTRGLLALYCNSDGILLAKSISSAVAYGMNRVERVPKYQALAMCRNPRFPQMLLETSFICNPDEYDIAVRAGTPKRTADAVAQGIVNYYKAQAAFIK